MLPRLNRALNTLAALPETDEQQQPTKPGISRTALVLLGVVAVVVLAIDRLSKFLVVDNLTLGEPVEIIGQLLQFHYVENPGAAFSLGSGSTWIFAIIASAVAVFIVIFARRIRSVGWAVLFGMLLGGNLGNLTDRLTREPGFGRGYVVDFIQVWGFPAIFNVADIAIVSSMGLFIILTLRGVSLDGTRAVRESKAESSPTDQS
jgi:signal peptidase II